MQGAKLGTSDIVLKVQESNPLHLFYEFNNHGTKLTHRARHALHFENNNFLQSADTFSGSFSLAEQGAFAAGSVQYGHDIEKWDTSLDMNASYVETMLIGHLKSSELKGESLNITPSLTKAFIKKPSFKLEGILAFEIKDSKTLTDDFKSNFDRMRVINVGPRLTWQDASGRTILSSEVHQGLPRFLGGSREADINASRQNSGGEFIYYTGTAVRVQRLPESCFLVTKATGQWSRDNLTSLEQFRLGGASTVRGYPESDSSGESGFVLSAELSVPAPWISKDWGVPFTKKKWRDALRFVGFLEGGKTFIRERSTEDVVKNKRLIGTGLGVRVDLDRTFSLQADLGFPIGDKSTDENQKQLHLYLRTGF